MLLKKFQNAGFSDVRVVDRRSVGLEEIARYPLFAPEFVDMLRRVTPPERHAEMVFSITVTARKAS